MIDKDTINSIAKLYNIKPWKQEKHYIQALVLVTLSEYPLIFKGGTYLWFFHNLNRFSEDVDFTLKGNLPGDIDKKVSEGLRLFGVENTIKSISNDARGFSFRISAKGPLNTSDVDLCHVYVEISKREDIVLTPLSFRLNFDGYEMPIKIINGMNLREVMAEKVRAIVSRNKARDMFDLISLINAKKIEFDLNLINQKLKYYNESFDYSKFHEHVKKKKEGWEKELKQLVFGKVPEFDSAVDIINNWVKK